VTGAAGGLVVVLVIVLLVGREAREARGRAWGTGRLLPPAIVPLLVIAGVILAARAASILR
jgi:hypothetical protein